MDYSNDVEHAHSGLVAVVEARYAVITIIDLAKTLACRRVADPAKSIIVAEFHGVAMGFVVDRCDCSSTYQVKRNYWLGLPHDLVVNFLVSRAS